MRDVAGEGAQTSSRVTAVGAFDFNDPGPKISETFGAIGAGDVVCKIEDQEIIERRRRHTHHTFVTASSVRDAKENSHPENKLCQHSIEATVNTAINRVWRF